MVLVQLDTKNLGQPMADFGRSCRHAGEREAVASKQKKELGNSYEVGSSKHESSQHLSTSLAGVDAARAGLQNSFFFQRPKSSTGHIRSGVIVAKNEVLKEKALAEVWALLDVSF